MGSNAPYVMLCYSSEELGVEKFQVRINIDNDKNISMFQKMGFSKVSESAVFN